MISKLLLSALAAILSALPMLAGCVSVNGSWYPPHAWTDTVTEEIRIDTTGLQRLEARTYNGEINYSGHTEGDPVAIITVRKKAGGHTRADAEAAFEALEIHVDDRTDQATRIHWEWAVPKEHGWTAEVSYEINAPAGVAFDAETYNGNVKVRGVEADTKITTYNGRIKLDCAGEQVSAETYNGNIEADVSRCTTVAGTLETYNGEIRMKVSPEYAGDLSCRTLNGHIRCDVPWTVRRASRGHLSGSVGDGPSSIRASTHNGSIRVKEGA